METHEIIFLDLKLEVTGTYYHGTFGDYETPPEPDNFEIEKVDLNGTCIYDLLDCAWTKSKKCYDTLLDELGKQDIPVLLKRGTWGTIDEILGACERVLVGGNDKIAICLRGVVGMPNYRHVFPSIRWAPDLMMRPALKELTNIPIIYDPSHSTGYRNFVKPISS